MIFTNRVCRVTLLVGSVCCVVAQAFAAAPQLPRASFLGVQASGVNQEVRSRLKLPAESGALVMDLVEGGSAKAAGLRPDDVIVAVDGQPVAHPGELIARIAPHRAGDRVAIEWIRDGKPQSTEVTMRPRPLESAPDTRTEYSAVSVNGTLRRTIITGPKDDAPHPAVLYMTGIGCFSQESLGVQSSEAQLLHGLARAGFITMRVEKSGVGDSQGAPCPSPAVDLRAEMAAYVEGLKALKASPRVNADRVFLLGLSIGGVEAPIIAQQVPVRGLVVVNTVAKPFIEYLLETRRRQNGLKGLPFDELDRHQRLGELCNHAMLVDGRAPDAIVSTRPECKPFIEYAAPYTFMQQWAALDLSAEWKRVDVPVLIVQGETDFVATVADAPLLRDIIESFHPGTATLAMIPSMDHFLTKAESMKSSMAGTSTTAGVFQPKVLETIETWLKARAAG
jgi:pimeloyl-ACP methyl ester carboxylesterase